MKAEDWLATVWFLAVLVWLTCSFCAGINARRKRLSGIGYFLFAFFFGPIGLLGSVLAAPGPPPQPTGTFMAICDRCSARQNVDFDSEEYTCWQCQLVTEFAESS